MQNNNRTRSRRPKAAARAARPSRTDRVLSDLKQDATAQGYSIEEADVMARRALALMRRRWTSAFELMVSELRQISMASVVHQIDEIKRSEPEFRNGVEISDAERLMQAPERFVLTRRERSDSIARIRTGWGAAVKDVEGKPGRPSKDVHGILHDYDAIAEVHGKAVAEEEIMLRERLTDVSSLERLLRAGRAECQECKGCGQPRCWCSGAGWS